MMTWETPQEFAQELALDWGMTTETRDDIAGRVEIFATDHSNMVRADRDRAYERIRLLQDQNAALFDDLNLKTELVDTLRAIAEHLGTGVLPPDLELRASQAIDKAIGD